MEYLLPNRFFMPTTELLFSLFFLIRICHAGKKADVTTSGTY